MFTSGEKAVNIETLNVKSEETSTSINVNINTPTETTRTLIGADGTFYKSAWRNSAELELLTFLCFV